MIIEGRAVRIEGDNIDTDVLYPGPYLSIEDPAEMRKYLFEGLDPALRDRLGGDTILIVDENFGTGSSREHVPRAMLESGVRCLIGKSFARIFFRNCINLGLLALTSPEVAEAARDDDPVRIDVVGRAIDVAGVSFPAPLVPPRILETLEAGGFVEWARAHPPDAPASSALLT